jgi:hypothetical protein
MLYAPTTATKSGAFRDWKEDAETAEIFLPLPPDTVKKDLVCIITADRLHIRHVRTQQTLLRAEPLAGPIVSEDSTWYLAEEDKLLNIVLAKVRKGTFRTVVTTTSTAVCLLA